MTTLLSVLVVDDHPLFREGLVEVVRAMEGVDRVEEAADGAGAVAAAAEMRPDVVVMDLHMPGVNGIEATRQIVTADPGARIVILTGDTDQTKIQQAVEAGALGYLLKDAEPEILFAAVRTAYARPVATDR